MLRLEGLRADSASSTALDHVTLDHVTLAVLSGELVVVEGDEGESRTALCEIAACVRRPVAGLVTIADRNVLSLQGSSLPFVRRNIGYLPGRPPFVRDETAIENLIVALAVRGVSVLDAKAQSQSLLADLGVQSVADRRMDMVGPEDERLVAIARALIGSPPVIVLDDPTAGLGASARERVAQALQAPLSRGSAILCVTSEPSWAALLEQQGGRYLQLQGGRILGGAPHISLVGADQSGDSLEGAG